MILRGNKAQGIWERLEGGREKGNDVFFIKKYITFLIIRDGADKIAESLTEA